MAVLTSLFAGDAARLGALYGLSVVDIKGIPEGSVNSNYALLLENGGRVFLRIFEEQSMATARREAALLKHLAQRGVRTPRPLNRVDLESEALCEYAGKPVLLFPWVNGVSLCQKQIDEAHILEVGRRLARIHKAGADFQGAPPNRFSREALLQRLEGIDSSKAALAKPDVQEAIAHLKARLKAHPEPAFALRLGVVHGDIFRDNVLWQGDEIAAILDFESASQGTAPFDLGVTLLAWCYGDTFHAGFCAAMSKGYRSERLFSKEELDILFDETCFAAMRFATTRITDFELRGLPGSYRDFRRYLKRLRDLEDLGPKAFLSMLGLC